MKNLNFSFKTAITLTAACITISLSSFFIQNYHHGKTQKMSTLSSGASTCFTRVTQTFTALMVKDLASTYLTSDFMNNTQECFNLANKEFDHLWGAAFQSGYKHINQIVSDLHWFHEKTQKLKKMVSEADSDLSLMSSNIINKYSALESAKNNFMDGLSEKINATNKWATAWFVIGFIALIVFAAVIISYGFQQKNQTKLFATTEKDMTDDIELSAAKVDRILENVFLKLEMNKTYESISNFYTSILEQQYSSFEKEDNIEYDDAKEQVDKTVTNQRVSESITADFHQAMTAVLESIQTKAFSHGIIIETDMEDDYKVRAEQEALGQFLYNIVNYAVENSLTQNEGRKIKLKTKPLGGTAYLKVGISNYCFNANELNYFNSTTSATTDLNMNLVIMKELTQHIGATMAIKNKISSNHKIGGCEIEIIFDRVKDVEIQKDISVVSVVKGTKQQILRSFQSEA